jgi:bifunctional oligoribonuclease and PAP phosphatase NrnA
VTGSAAAVAEALRPHQSFVLTSHARPDGDAIGSSMALALALEALGKQTTVVLHDAVPAPYRVFPFIDRIVVADRFEGHADATVILECSEPSRPEVAGLERPVVINVDHHLGNTMYGTVNWFDVSAAACGELVAEIIDELGVTWTPEIASHLYLAIATDTGSFRYGPISPRTFEICRRIAVTGVQTSALSRQIFDSFSVGRVRLTGALLDGMTLHHGNRLAVLCYDDDILRESGATVDDSEGLVNLPLGAQEVVAVALIKQLAPDRYRISLRSKGAVDVRAVAGKWGGGGHANAAGFSMTGELHAIKESIVTAIGEALGARL